MLETVGNSWRPPDGKEVEPSCDEHQVEDPVGWSTWDKVGKAGTVGKCWKRKLEKLELKLEG